MSPKLCTATTGLKLRGPLTVRSVPVAVPAKVAVALSGCEWLGMILSGIASCTHLHQCIEKRWCEHMSGQATVTWVW